MEQPEAPSPGTPVYSSDRPEPFKPSMEEKAAFNAYFKAASVDEQRRLLCLTESVYLTVNNRIFPSRMIAFAMGMEDFLRNGGSGPSYADLVQTGEGCPFTPAPPASDPP